MISELARVGGAVGALGIAALFYGPTRTWRVGGLAAWAAGCLTLALWLAPSGHHRVYAAAAVVGAAAAAAAAGPYAGAVGAETKSEAERACAAE